MKLFFETADQARVFLAAIPIGFAVAALLNVASASGRSRLLWDALIPILGGFALLAFGQIMGEDGLRLYHLLALLTGALLYLAGVGRLFRACRRRFQKRKKNRVSKKESDAAM